jgi:hypothetical protein
LVSGDLFKKNNTIDPSSLYGTIYPLIENYPSYWNNKKESWPITLPKMP